MRGGPVYITDVLYVISGSGADFFSPGQNAALRTYIVPSGTALLIREGTSGRCHSAKIFPGSEEVFEPIVVAHDPVNNPPAATHDLRRQHHNEVQEATELHPE